MHKPLFAYNGNVKDLLKLNKNSTFNLDSKQYNLLSDRQYDFLKLTLSKKVADRPTSKELLNFFMFNVDTKQKSIKKR